MITNFGGKSIAKDKGMDKKSVVRLPFGPNVLGDKHGLRVIRRAEASKVRSTTK